MKDVAIVQLCFALACIILCVGIGIAFARRKNIKAVVRVLGVTVYAMMCCMIFPNNYLHNTNYAVGLTLFESMCAMLLDSSPIEMIASFDGIHYHYLALYQSILFVLLIIAPLFTVGVTISFFSERFVRIVYRVQSIFRDSYIFTAMNERSVTTAENIFDTERGHGRTRPLILFVCESADEVESEYLERLTNIQALRMKNTVLNLQVNHKRACNYYLLDVESSVNIAHAISLHESAQTLRRQPKSVNMWLYCKGEVADIVFDNLNAAFRITYINEEKLIANELVKEHPLYTGIQQECAEGTVRQSICVLLIGCGNVGMQILKNIVMDTSFTAQLAGEIHVVDFKANKVEAQFRKQTNRLMDLRNISFHQADVTSNDFVDCLGAITPSYIVCAMDNLNRNIETGIFVRRFYGDLPTKPPIHLLIEKEYIKDKLLSKLVMCDWQFDGAQRTYHKAQTDSFALKTFGSYETTYRHLHALADIFECLAIASHAVSRGMVALCDDTSTEQLMQLFYETRYYKELWTYYALNIPNKLFLLGITLERLGCQKWDAAAFEAAIPLLEGALCCNDATKAENIAMLAGQENMRFEAYMRSNGWREMPLDKIKNGGYINKLTKEHARIDNTHAALLSELYGKDILQLDKEAVLQLPLILKLAVQIYHESTSLR